MDSFLMSEEDLRKREEQKRRKLEAMADLAEICTLPAGTRFLSRTLRDLGLGRPVSPASVDCHNFAMRLLDDICYAAPEAWNEILRQVFRRDE